MTRQRRARAVVPGAHISFLRGVSAPPHLLSRRTGGLHTHPMYLIVFLFWFRELVLLDFVFFPFLSFMMIINTIFEIMHLLKQCHLTQGDHKCLHTRTLTHLFLMPLTRH